MDVDALVCSPAMRGNSGARALSERKLWSQSSYLRGVKYWRSLFRWGRGRAQMECLAKYLPSDVNAKLFAARWMANKGRCCLILRCVDFPLGPIKLRSTLAIVLWWDFERWTHYLLHHSRLPMDSQKGKAIKITRQTFICQYVSAPILVTGLEILVNWWKF
jgi:hypothetical protein